MCRRKTTSCIAITNVDSNDRSSLSKLVESVKTNYNERGEEIKRHWGGGSLGNKSAAKVKYEEVLLKWRVDQLTHSLVHNYLKTVSPALANEFKVKYQPDETKLELAEVLSKWKEEQLVKGLVLNHLKTVAPSLAVEFDNKHELSVKLIPKRLIGLIQRTLPAIAGNARKYPSTEKRDEKVQLCHFAQSM